jgi:predicted P-loop ATPase
MWDVLANPWFTDAPLHIQDKSAVEVMRGKWIVELAEMDTLTKYESQTIKGFLSRTEDRCRMAYERKTQNFPRQNVFVGSLNPELTGWLKDRTGNRRYWPVTVSRIDISELKRVRHELWAEALEIYKKGERLFVDDANMRSLMSQEVETRMQQDPWFAVIEEHLHSKANDYMTEEGIVISPSELYSRCIGGSAVTFRYQEAGRMASILSTLGFEKIRKPEKLGFVYLKRVVEEVL